MNPDERLGSGPCGISDIKAHRWFSGIDWEALEARLLPAPITPQLDCILDTCYFDGDGDNDDHDDAGDSSEEESEGGEERYERGGDGFGRVAAQPVEAAGAAGAADNGDDGMWADWDWIPESMAASQVIGQ